jgi:hypothetical protein
MYGFDILSNRLDSAVTPRREELQAVDAIRAAYLALATMDDGSVLAWEVTPGNSWGGTPTALGHLAEAGRLAWVTIFGDPRAAEFWDLMQDNGENAVYQWNLYAEANDL